MSGASSLVGEGAKEIRVKLRKHDRLMMRG